MTELPQNWSRSGHVAVEEQLARILRSRPFRQSERRQRFLQYVVREALAGRADRLKGYTLAVEVFDRPSSFDPAIDPVVRIEAARLRDKLREYYDTQGKADPIRIELPVGSYAPQIEIRSETAASDQPAKVSETPAPEPSPEAVQESGDVAPPALVPSITARLATGKAPLTLMAGAVLVVVLAALWLREAPRVGPTLPDKPSIAVLPFDNIGHDAQWERFADGLTEDIITDLSHAKDLLVIARNSTEMYKNKPVYIRQVGRDLNVKYVLEGSIQPIGERIRVTAQLIEATSGSHVWSERYDRPAADLFAVQNEVTQRIAATLVSYQGAVAEAERGVARRKPPASLTAYDTYLLGIEAKHKVTKESLLAAEALFRKAIELDPQFARAYCALATVQYYLIDLGLAPSVEGAVRVMAEAAQRAVELDPNDGLTHQVLGMALGYQGKRTQSLAELNRAEALAPSDADLLLIVAWSLPSLGEPGRAVSMADRALALNPRYPDWYNQGLSLVYFFGGLFDRALEYRLLVKEPVAIDYAFLAITYAHLGRAVDAKAAAEKVASLDPAWNAERYLSEAGGYAEREAELFVDAARKAGLSGCVPGSQLPEVPNLVRVGSCDRNRAG